LFSRFRDEKVYWEFFIILRKLLISCSVIFFSGGFEMLIVLFSMLVIFVSFILQIHNVPYKRSFHNFMEYVVLLSIEALLFCALLFFVNDFPAPWIQDTLGWVCIAIIILSTIIIGILILIDFVAQWREDIQAGIIMKETLKKKELESGLDPLFKFKAGRQQRTNIIDTTEDEGEKIQQKTAQSVQNNQQQQKSQTGDGIQIQINDSSVKPIQQQQLQQQRKSRQGPIMIELGDINNKPKYGVGEVLEMVDIKPDNKAVEIKIKKSGIEEI